MRLPCYYRQQWARVLQKASLQIWANDPNLSHLIVPDDLRIISPKEVDDVFKKVTARTKHEQITLRIALMDVHVHDLRRTFGSFQALTGASLQIIGKSLGHKSLQATQVYARLNLDPVRHAMQKATNAMFNSQ
ncbi:tyrosine-type recombinase/integrase [Daejeonella sp.]|uniref:tyrosine-type recombinase/integrase n=1 Tax=Daejeonella sp. TaxID=2805397 RepID=UPI0030BCE4E0